MGGAWVKQAPVWQSPYPAGGEYDMWGYLPNGLKPPQHEWNQFYQQGHPPAVDKGNSLDPLIVGQFNDKLEVFGNKGDTMLNGGLFGRVDNRYGWDTHFSSYPLLASNSMPANSQAQQFAQIVPGINVSDEPWKPTQATCNPISYPNCSLVDMRESAPLIQPHTGWWSSVAGIQVNALLGKPGSMERGVMVSQNIDTEHDPGKLENPMDNWVSSIDRAVSNYSNGGTAALDETNSTDTSAFDPCDDPLVLEMVVPLVFAYLGQTVYTALMQDSGDTLPPLATTPMHIGVVAGFWFIGKAAAVSVRVAGTKEPLDPTAEGRNLDLAARMLSEGLSMGVGTMVAGQSQYEWAPYAGLAAGSFLGGPILYPPITAFLHVSSFVTDIALIPVFAVNVLARWLCLMSDWGHTACNDFLRSKRAEFQDARRWDVGSIAARLTDIACDTEGWERDSPQARFVYEGLMRNPMFMQAAMLNPSGEAADGKPGVYGKHATNPLGEIAPIHESGFNRIEAKTFGGVQITDHGPEYTPWLLDNTINFQQTWSSLAGDGDVDYTLGLQNHNRFACQNWDILFNADEDCDEKDDPAKPSCKKAKNPAITGEDKALASRMKKWLSALVVKANDPNNFRRAELIPGLDDGKFNPRHALQVPPKVYLAHCTEDNSGEFGFNTVLSRGQYALESYLANNSWHIDSGTVEEVLIVANSFFAYDNENAAFAAAVQDVRWDVTNRIALVHYWNAAKGVAQQKDFEKNWMETSNPTILKYLGLPDPGFTPFGDNPNMPTVPQPFWPLQPRNTCVTQVQKCLAAGDMVERIALANAKVECPEGVEWASTWLKNNALYYNYVYNHSQNGTVTPNDIITVINTVFPDAHGPATTDILFCILGQDPLADNIWFYHFWSLASAKTVAWLLANMKIVDPPAHYPNVYYPDGWQITSPIYGSTPLGPPSYGSTPLGPPIYGTTPLGPDPTKVGFKPTLPTTTKGFDPTTPTSGSSPIFPISTKGFDPLMPTYPTVPVVMKHPFLPTATHTCLELVQSTVLAMSRAERVAVAQSTPTSCTNAWGQFWLDFNDTYYSSVDKPINLQAALKSLFPTYTTPVQQADIVFAILGQSADWKQQWFYLFWADIDAASYAFVMQLMKDYTPPSYYPSVYKPHLK